MSHFNDLLLHKNSLTQLRAVLKRPSHAILISGAIGSGKAYLASQLASEFLHLDKAKILSNYPYFSHLKRSDDKQDIPIDSVRNLNRILKLKVPGSAEIKRIVLIEDAQDLNEESSNALLKMLEEPPADCIFILTAKNPKSLLPTIVSRAQLLQVDPVSLSQAQDYWQGQFSKTKIESAWQLSQGSVGLIQALLRDQSNHPLMIAIEEAKEYLKMDRYQRLLASDKLSRDKQKLRLMLEALARLLSALHRNAADRGNTVQQKKLLASRKLVSRLRDMLDSNASPKLIALELSLNLL